MSYQRNNYGRGGRGGGGGGNFQPKPRPQLSAEHLLDPRIESILNNHESKRDLREYAVRGGETSKDTILFNSDPERKSMLVAQASMLINYQFGVPLDHEEYPGLKKFDTFHDSHAHYAVYQSPIHWRHDKSFVHIPCFTRYVIDVHGRVLNAYNGKRVPGLNPYMIELVPDGPSNMLTKVQFDFLKQLAFLPLPEGFIDYGFRTYSHDIGMDVKAGQVGWIAKGKVKVKNNETGMVGEYPNLPHLAKCCNNDFDLMREFSRVTREGIKGEIVNIGPFTIKESEPTEQPGELPVINVSESTTTAPVDDFAAPAQQDAPAAQVSTSEEPPKKDDFDFNNVDF